MVIGRRGRMENANGNNDNRSGIFTQRTLGCRIYGNREGGVD